MKVERAPGLPLRRHAGCAPRFGMALPRLAFAPGKSGVAVRRRDFFGIARLCFSDGVAVGIAAPAACGIRSAPFWMRYRALHSHPNLLVHSQEL